MSKYWITPEGKYIVGYNADIAPQNATEVPEAPEADTDIWDGTQWNADPVATAANARSKRNLLLAETDWHGLSDNVMSEEMATYRQGLRDVPEQDEFPNEVTWPDSP
tara:strand:+ start:905 stop:1225 length:321 start_codon:yes stop_codon:yes gene_type:complete